MTKHASLESNLEEIILKYLEHCEIVKNLSQNTIKMYHFYLMDFLNWLRAFLNKENIKLSDITDENINKYRLDLNRRISFKSNEEFKRSTQKTFLVALRAFFEIFSSSGTTRYNVTGTNNFRKIGGSRAKSTGS